MYHYFVFGHFRALNSKIVNDYLSMSFWKILQNIYHMYIFPVNFSIKCIKKSLKKSSFEKKSWFCLACISKPFLWNVFWSLFKSLEKVGTIHWSLLLDHSSFLVTAKKSKRGKCKEFLVRKGVSRLLALWADG